MSANFEIILFLIVSAYFVYVIFTKLINPSLKQIRQLKQIMRIGNAAMATIVDYETDKDPDGIKSYIPVVELLLENKVIRVATKIPQKEKPLIGTEAIVYFNNEKPGELFLDLDDALTKSYIPVLIGGVAMCVILFFVVKRFL